MLLTNGSDAVLLDYSGSMFTGFTGHAHYEKHQSTPTGWYKAAHPSYTTCQTMPPIMQCGYQVIGNGEVLDPSDYAQEFNPRTGILRSTVTFRGAIVHIETFFSQDAILAERYELQDQGAYASLALALVLMPAHPQTDLLTFRDPVTGQVHEGTDLRRLDATYEISPGIRGCGAMITEVAGTRFMSFPRGACGILVEHIQPGWSISRTMTFVDSSESSDLAGAMASRQGWMADMGYGGLRQAHLHQMSRFQDHGAVQVPDGAMQYLLHLALYVVRGSLHPQTGGLTDGLLPHLWGGATYCIGDAMYLHRALLLAGYTDLAERHLGFYRGQFEQSCRDTRAAGVEGCLFPGWNDWQGHPRFRDADPRQYILHTKPWFSALVLLMIYWQWKYAGEDAVLDRYFDIAERIATALRTFVLEDGPAVQLKRCRASNESEIDVENDTMTLLCLARAFQAFGEMAQVRNHAVEPTLAALPGKLTVLMNRNHNGKILLPYQNATYSAGLQFRYFLFNLPDGIDSSSIYDAENLARTPWGLDNQQPSECYRDWPWLASRASICYSHLGDASRAFSWLLHPLRSVSSLGALPEKIRLDGYPINYWYTTPYALLLWSMYAALVHRDKNGQICLLFGLDGAWQDLTARNLALPGGVRASLSVRKGQLTSLSLTNSRPRPLHMRLTLNRRYQADSLPDTVALAGNSQWQWDAHSVRKPGVEPAVPKSAIPPAH